jgi:nucleoid-associated protein YgaU
MNGDVMTPLPRVVLAAAAAAAGGWGLWWCAQPRLLDVVAALDGSPASRQQWSLADVVAAAVAVAAVIAYAALVATALVAIGSHVLTPHHAATVAARGWAGPRWWRTLVLTACGIGITAQAAAASGAAAAPDGPPCAAACTPSLDGLPYPDLPIGPWAPLRADRADRADRSDAPRRDPPAERLVVRPGDTLWAIAADLSPTRATAADIARLAHRLYAANREVIGDDPDLIYPGTVLKAPGGPA